MSIETISLAEISVDQRAQPRGNLNTDITRAYADEMKEGADFPPLTVFFDGETHWLADGFHRRYAASSAGIQALPCEIRDGTLRDAILYSCGANSEHGYQRSDEDKRRAVTRMLDDDEWRSWADREIARQCRVSPTFVGKIRQETNVTVHMDSERTYTTKHGTKATMNTEAIGGGHASPTNGNARPRVTRSRDPAVEMEPPKRPGQGRAAICTRVREAISALSGLPPPATVAGYFRGTDEAILVDERISSAADWLAEFVEIWKDSDNAED